MKRYRVVMTFQARSLEEAAAIVADPERMPRDSKMQVVDVDQWRAFRRATFVGLVVGFWFVVAAAVLHAWR